MLSAQSKLALHFSGEIEHPIEDFLEEYEELADNCRLSNLQKVETVIQYVDHSQRHIWQSLPGYINHNWDDFHDDLCEEYVTPSAENQFSRQKLAEFANKYTRRYMNDKTDIINYQRQFNNLTKVLVKSSRVTERERNTTFWHGFHPDNQKVLHECLIAKHPDQPRGQVFDLKDVLTTTRAVFLGNDDFLLQEPPFQHSESAHTQERRTERSSRDQQESDHDECTPRCECTCDTSSFDCQVSEDEDTPPSDQEECPSQSHRHPSPRVETRMV